MSGDDSRNSRNAGRSSLAIICAALLSLSIFSGMVGTALHAQAMSNYYHAVATSDFNEPSPISALLT